MSRDIDDLISRMQEAAEDCDHEDRVDCSPIAAVIREAIAKLEELQAELNLQ